MSHVRKRIRRVLDDMGFKNAFQLHHRHVPGRLKDEDIVVTIQDWEPHPDAIRLKKFIQRCADDECMDVEFQVLNRGERHRTWKPGLSRH